jgi:hypothetical protein
VPRFYFDIDDGHSAPDPEGHELDDVTIAKCEAIKMAGRIICDSAEEFWDRAEWSMTVTNEARLTLFTLHIVGVEAPVIAPMIQVEL